MDCPTVEPRIPLHDSRDSTSSREDNEDETREQEEPRAKTFSISEKTSTTSHTTDDNPFTSATTDINDDGMDSPRNILRDRLPAIAINSSSTAAPSHSTADEHSVNFSGVELEDVTEINARVATTHDIPF